MHLQALLYTYNAPAFQAEVQLIQMATTSVNLSKYIDTVVISCNMGDNLAITVCCTELFGSHLTAQKYRLILSY